ncbi:MAG: HlyD family secretion protein [Beijerinckiaceae bacterium]|nr:HlyD family secretion protein [Beijerinckiaceae bacterium]
MSINVRPSDIVTETQKAPPAPSHPPVEAKPTARAAPPTSDAPATAETGPKGSRKKIVLRVALLAALIAGGYKAYEYVTVGQFIVSTDDAYVRADMAVLAAKVSGYVQDVAVRDNVSVKAGDLLTRIDDGDYRNALDTAEARYQTQKATIDRIGDQAKAQMAAIEQAKAQVASAKADLVRTQADFERANSLAKLDFGSQQRLDTARADRDKSAAMLASANASVQSAEGALAVYEGQKVEAQRQLAEIATSVDKAKRDLSFTEIRAPFDGVVGNRAAQPGQYVQPGTRLLALVPLDSVYVDANLKETQLANIKVGQKASVTVDAMGSRHIEATVESFSPATGSMFSLLPPENATGNFTKIVQRVPVRIKLPADVIAEGKLRPGLSVVVEIDTRSGDQNVAARK